MTYNNTFFLIGVIGLLAAMSPGPDFVIVVQNSLLHSRRSGYFTSLGVGFAILVHMSYCLLGLAIIISSSNLIFNVIKYIGASYLIYLGIKALFSQLAKTALLSRKKIPQKTISNSISFKQGLLCNLLNPKATLFFLSFFTVIIKPGTSIGLRSIYAFEIFFITTTWFCVLATILSHSYVKRILEKAEKYIAKLLGILLVGFGVVLVLA